jgi:hypothetical protein
VNRVSLFVAGVVVAVATMIPMSTASAQDAPQPYRNAISANPFGLLLELFNVEYERVVGESSTVGVGGSYYNNAPDEFDPESSDVDYRNVDVFYRYYPQGRPLDGWAFGGKVGLTTVPDEGTYFGYGFDVNRSWLLGKNNNFYVGVGIGLKKLVGTSEETFDLEYVPTFRIVNIGFAF